MNKIITLILCLCCVFTTAWADDAPALNPSDANIVVRLKAERQGGKWKEYYDNRTWLK